MSVQVLFLVALQAVVTAALWLLNPLSPNGTNVFALSVSADILAFVMISYIYRSSKYGREPSAAWFGTGCLVLLILLTANILSA